MPTTLPGMSVTKAAELLQTQDQHHQDVSRRSQRVWGKAGRAATATDPAPVEMFETVINLKPEDEWRAGHDVDKLIAEMDKALQFPGVSNAWTMPIKARIDMLSTGIRTPVGVKVYRAGPRRHRPASRGRSRRRCAGARHRQRLRRACQNGYYLEIDARPPALARYGLTVGDVQETIAYGARRRDGHDDGRGARALHRQCPLSSRAFEKRSAGDRDARCWCRRGAAPAVPLGQVASVRPTQGPPMIRTENAQLVNYIYRRHA